MFSSKRFKVAHPTEQHDPAVAALREYAENADQFRTDDVHIFTLKNRRYVMKFDRPMGRTRRRAWASAALCGILFGKFPRPQHLLPGGIRHEAQRLRTLRKHGVRVPKVHLVTDDHLILEHSGETVETLLKTSTEADERTRLLWAVVDDLIDFHLAGHWHGGAQVRNMTLKDGVIYRIDFEEQIGTAFPLPFAQAFDVLLAFNSMVDYFHGNSHALGTKLLTHYLDQTRSEQVIKILAKLDNWLKHFHHLEPRLPRPLRKKRDVQRTQTFAWILNSAITPYQTMAIR